MAHHSVIGPPRLRETPFMPDAAPRPRHETPASSSAGGHGANHGLARSDDVAADGPRPRRTRDRSSGGFLLRDSPADWPARDRRLGRRFLRDSTRSHTSRTSRTPESLRSAADGDGSLAPSSASRPSTMSPSSRAKSSAGSSDGPPPDAASLDADSAHIVNMALNLSESRRLASRSAFARGTPPRLAPVPDSGAAANLRQHLQQQRRSSQNTSPRPKLAASRLSSGVWLGGPSQPAADTAHDAQFRYHFSPSTLARAQKARRHLELMAEYRRLLETLPPLDPDFHRHGTASSPTSPTGKNAKSGHRNNTRAPLGRHYNPLQYIRNRKVRARERKVIDAERQGFGDVDSVRSWVDQVCNPSSSPTAFLQEGDEPALPPFPDADRPESQSDAAASRAGARLRRPRVDWFVEPCDMLADAYWLEQHDHKHLVEDRHWRKIFPPAASPSRPMSRDSEAADDQPRQPERQPVAPAAAVAEVDSDLSNNSTKDRAKQKLHNIKAFPHRHSGSLHGHHRLRHHDSGRPGRDSASDISGSDSDARFNARRKLPPGRRGTLTSDAHDLLEKQMMEMVAKEARERELAGHGAPAEKREWNPTLMSPEMGNTLSPPFSRSLSRPESMVDTSDSDRKATSDKARQSSPHRRQPRQRGVDESEVLSNTSAEKLWSFAASPELLPSKANVAESVTLSPPFSPTWSRSESPSRNPLSRIRSIIREKSTESTDSVPLAETEQDVHRPTPVRAIHPPPPQPGLSHRRSLSPTKKVASERQLEGWKTHRRSGSLLQRLDEQGAGLRGMLRGPRIDNVLRGSVSRLGDILWKKDGMAEPSLDVNSTDESEGERAGGRHKTSSPPPHGLSTETRDESQQDPRHSTEAMPGPGNAWAHQWQSPNGGHFKETTDGITSHSSRSSRFELLKPPSVEMRSASPSVSPVERRRGRPGDGETWESDSWQESVAGNADGRPDAAAAQAPDDAAGKRQSRPWSVADLEPSTTKTRPSRREVARMKALILSSGIKAMEISRRANETCEPFSSECLAADRAPLAVDRAGIDWASIARLSPDKRLLPGRQAAFRELYPLAARELASAIRASGQRWHVSADGLTKRTSPDLQRRIGRLRSRLVDDLSEMARRAANEADETSRDLALGQPLKVKHVTDTMDKILRRRRRRLRWLRRALWLMVEWLLVGLMWYVWFVVMILRLFLGVGRGAWRGLRWLLWM